MNIEYTKRQLNEDCFGLIEGPLNAPLGYLLFVEQGCYFGVLPPIYILNEMLAEGSIVNSSNTRFEWEPFELSEEDYQELQSSLLEHPEWGGEIDRSFKSASKDEWSHWALVRSLGKDDDR